MQIYDLTFSICSFITDLSITFLIPLFPSVGDEEEELTGEFGEPDAAILGAAEVDSGVVLPPTELFRPLPATRASAFLSNNLPIRITMRVTLSS